MMIKQFHSIIKVVSNVRLLTVKQTCNFKMEIFDIVHYCDLPLIFGQSSYF